MRDLQSIAEINGPKRKELQTERAHNIIANSHQGKSPKEVRAEHGRRFEERKRVNS